MAPALDLPVGSVLTRAERQARWGGSIQGGIQPSASSPHVFIYSDPVAGEKYGYTFDGWTEDGSVYLYTGEGSTGDQLLVRGNRVIIEHRNEGRALQLFIVDGSHPVGGKRHRYIGEFEVDPAQPYAREDAPDGSGEMRSVLIFRLRPVGDVDQISRDANPARPDVVPAGRSDLVAPEQNITETFPTGATPPSESVRRESALVDRYLAHLRAQGHEVGRWRITPPGELKPLLTDLYDITTTELYEAKGSVSRASIRMAIGQLFDYRRHIATPELRLAILVPTAPSRDLVDLIRSLDIGLVYPAGGGFVNAARR